MARRNGALKLLETRVDYVGRHMRRGACRAGRSIIRPSLAGLGSKGLRTTIADL